jgi:hypothetical protein
MNPRGPTTQRTSPGAYLQTSPMGTPPSR